MGVQVKFSKFSNSCIENRNGYVGESTSINHILGVGLGENVLIRAIFENKVGSDTDMRVRVWQDGGDDSNFHQIAPGERAFFAVKYEPVIL